MLVRMFEGFRGVITGCLARDAMGFLIASHEGCSDDRGVIIGCPVGSAMSFLIASHEGSRDDRGVIIGCPAGSAMGFLIASHEGCSGGRGVIPGNLFRDAAGFLFATTEGVVTVEELSPVISFGTRRAFSSLLLWSYRSFRACQALEAVSRVAMLGRIEWSTAVLSM